MTAGDRAAQGAAALATLLAVAGLPAALTVLVGWPLPSQVPDAQDATGWVTQPISSQAVVATLTVIAWLAWAHFVLCFVVELVNATARRGRPAWSVPFGGANQDTARKLVTALLLVGAAGPLAAGSAAAAVPDISTISSHQQLTFRPNTKPAPVSAAGQTLPAPSSTDSSSTTAHASAPGSALREYVVAPPAAGYHDNLWDIAEKHLGEGTRWAQIQEMNAGLTQPDGAALDDPDLIRPGWRLQMPADAVHLPLWGESLMRRWRRLPPRRSNPPRRRTMPRRRGRARRTLQWCTWWSLVRPCGA